MTVIWIHGAPEMQWKFWNPIFLFEIYFPVLCKYDSKNWLIFLSLFSRKIVINGIIEIDSVYLKSSFTKVLKLYTNFTSKLLYGIKKNIASKELYMTKMIQKYWLMSNFICHTFLSDSQNHFSNQSLVKPFEFLMFEKGL